MNHNYIIEMKRDIYNYIKENFVEVNENNSIEIKEYLYDELWLDDSITGNGSGSYTFNSNIAKQNVIDSEDILYEMVDCGLMTYEEIGKKFVLEEYEELDVAIRCHLLYDMINNVVDDINTYGTIREELEE